MSKQYMAFAGGPFNHDETGRQPGRLQKLIEAKNAQAVLLHKGQPALDKNGQLMRVHPSDLIGKNLLMPGPIYLGLDGDVPLFAAELAAEDQMPLAESFDNLRNIAGYMKTEDLAIIGRAKSLFAWHSEHQFCAGCGQRSQVVMGGLRRDCRPCNLQHFPRVNPVAIMLVEHDDAILLGRQASWPAGAYSALAGFVSPGETLEEATFREVWEETGVKTRNHKYVFSQPWPFPSQLMMGVHCFADDRKLTINTGEIETAQWFDRGTVEAVFAKESDAFLRPPKFTIAHQLMRWWIGQ